MQDKASGKLARQLAEGIDDDEENITPQIPPEKEKEAPAANQY